MPIKYSRNELLFNISLVFEVELKSKVSLLSRHVMMAVVSMISSGSTSRTSQLAFNCKTFLPRSKRYSCKNDHQQKKNKAVFPSQFYSLMQRTNKYCSPKLNSLELRTYTCTTCLIRQKVKWVQRERRILFD